ncbi:MAG: hypothetical protein EBZ79_05065 [Actinobacteria bacterium]|nr:hypothetical protein [Actinomycetota bacterium]
MPDATRLAGAPDKARTTFAPAPLSVSESPVPDVDNKREFVSSGCDVAVINVPVNTGLDAIAPVVVWTV